MLSPKPAGHEFRNGRFVQVALSERDGKRADWPSAVSCHQGYQQGRINTTRQKRTDRHITDHLALDGVVEQGFEFPLIRGSCCCVYHRRAPVTLDCRLIGPEAPLEAATGFELVHAVENGTRRGNIVERHQITHGDQVNLAKYSQCTKWLERR